MPNPLTLLLSSLMISAYDFKTRASCWVSESLETLPCVVLMNGGGFTFFFLPTRARHITAVEKSTPNSTKADGGIRQNYPFRNQAILVAGEMNLKYGYVRIVSRQVIIFDSWNIFFKEKLTPNWPVLFKELLNRERPCTPRFAVVSIEDISNKY